MDGYRRSSHTIYDNRFHLVWVTKYRYHIFDKRKKERCREVIREVCRTNDVDILSGHVSSDHIHIYVSVPPHLAVSKLMQFIKGKTSRVLQIEFPDLKRRYWGRHIWARGYFSATVGEVSDKVIREYIASQEKHHQNDSFNVLYLGLKIPRL